MVSNFSDFANTGARQLNSNLTSVTNNLAQNAYLTATNSNYAPRYTHKVLNNDTLQLDDKKTQAKAKVQEIAQNIDTKKARKIAISLALSVGTVLAVTLGTNKNINKIWKLGEKVDGLVAKNKVCQKAGEVLNTVKAKNPLNKSKLFQDIKNVTSRMNRVQPNNSWAKMSVFGPKGIFSLTAPDVLGNTARSLNSFKPNLLQRVRAFLGKGLLYDPVEVAKNQPKFAKYLEALVGKETKICGQSIQEISEACLKGNSIGEDSFKFSTELLNAIKSKHNLKTTQDMLNFFDKMKIGQVGSETFDFAKDIKMKGWIKGSRGNLGETMKKFAIMNGDSATTKAGKLVQQMPLIFSESVGNCINDRSAFGIAMCASYLPQTFNEAQDAQKGKKAKTATSELVSSAAGWAIGTASAGSIVYSAASLKNLTTSGAAAGALKKVGKVMSMGLDKSSSGSAKMLGGALRLAAVMALSNKFTKPIDNGVKKAFGVPTEAEKARLEEQKRIEQNMQNLSA